MFYEAAAVLTTFVLLGHWFEMRARGGSNDAIRTLLELAPARALVQRDGGWVEVDTADVQVGDLGSFAVGLPGWARDHDLSVYELSPSDESLESVFAYLVAR